MADRLMPDLPKVVYPLPLHAQTAAIRRRRRALAAFVTGATLVAAGSVVMRPDGAGAAGGPGFLSFIATALGTRQPEDATPRLVEVSIDPTTPAKPAKRKQIAASPLTSRRPVCVRLCDGSFFPLDVAGAASADGETDCAELCPGASTALYFIPAGSDRIETATSTSGARYTALATALRYRTTHDNACTCHATLAGTTPYWQDPTLRKGDAVMTANGFMVYRGGPRSPFGPGAFTRLAEASMPRNRRADLMAIERVSALPAREAEKPQIAAAGPSAKAGAANEIHFVGRLPSATN